MTYLPMYGKPPAHFQMLQMSQFVPETWLYQMKRNIQQWEASIELSSRDVIPVDVTITRVHAVKNCIDKPIGKS